MSPPLYASLQHRLVYVPPFGDNIRVGTFVHIWNSSFDHMDYVSKDPEATSIAQIIGYSPGFSTGVHLMLYPPLFPTTNQKHPDHPTLPRHNQRKIVSGFGSGNIKLYQSNRRLSVSPQAITQIAFVFSYNEISKAELSWTDGIENVFVSRFYERLPSNDLRGDEYTLLRPFPDDMNLCFPNQQSPEQYGAGPSNEMFNMLGGQQCFHESVFAALFSIRQSLIHMLNKRAVQVEHHNSDSAVIGLGAKEMWLYLYISCSTKSVGVIHPSKGRDSYLHVDRQLTRMKLPFLYTGSTFRFETEKDLDVLRKIFGYASMACDLNYQMVQLGCL